jgi:hypothetical protein
VVSEWILPSFLVTEEEDEEEVSVACLVVFSLLEQV